MKIAIEQREAYRRARAELNERLKIESEKVRLHPTYRALTIAKFQAEIRKLFR